MNEKERYKLFCENEKSIPIFSQPWWMDAVCGEDNWNVYLVGKDNDIRASFVYYYEEKHSVEGIQKKISRAILTQNNGIFIKYPSKQGIISRQKYEEKIIDEVCDFIENLNLNSYDQQFHYSFQNYLPFFWRYYKGCIKYTYVIENDCTMEEIREAYSSKLKNELRKALKYVSVTEIDDLGEFYRVNKLSFDRQRIDIPYSFNLFCDLVKKCKEHNCCMLLSANDANGRVSSVAMLIWDDSSVYYLLNGTDPKLKSLQGNYVLIDYSIDFANKRNLKFDFEGSVIKGVNHAIRNFGGIPKPYFRISKNFEQL